MDSFDIIGILYIVEYLLAIMLFCLAVFLSYRLSRKVILKKHRATEISFVDWFLVNSSWIFVSSILSISLNFLRPSLISIGIPEVSLNIAGSILVALLSYYLCRRIILRKHRVAALAASDWLLIIGSFLLLIALFIILHFFIYSIIAIIFSPISVFRPGLPPGDYAAAQ